MKNLFKLKPKKATSISCSKAPLFFVHIPKTAGTSLRLAAESYFKKEKIAKQYGLHSKETADWVKQTIIQQQDPFQIINAHRDQQCDFYVGHVPVAGLRGIFNHQSIFTFVRDPVEQVVSHFNHYKKIHGYTEDFSTFIHEKRFQNFQSRFLKNIPLQLIGFIGITEHYATSLQFINAFYNINLPELYLNQNKSSDKLKITDSIKDQVAALNQQDMALYKKALCLFEQRKIFHHQWVYGAITEQKGNVVSGFAFYAFLNDAVELSLFIDGKQIQKTKASLFRPGLCQFDVSRRGYIGFQFKGNFSNKKIEVLITETKQTLLMVYNP